MISVGKKIGFLLLLTILVGCSKTSLSVELKSDTFEVGTLKSACEAVKSVNGEAVRDIDAATNVLVTEADTVVSCSASDLETLGETILVFESKDVQTEQIITLSDTTPPVIHFDQTEIKVEVDNQYFKLADLIKVTDNFDKNVQIVIDGAFNIKKVGAYPVVLLAKDTSGNESRKEVIIHVLEKEKEIVTVIEEVPVYVDGGSGGSNGNGNGNENSGNGGSSSGGGVDSKGPKPSGRYYLFSDGYNIQTAPNACSSDLTDAYNAGWGGACLKYFLPGNTSSIPDGMELVIYD